MKVPFTNRGKHIATIGGVRVYPDETRMVEERDHPDYPTARPEKRPRKRHSDPVLALLDSPIADIVPRLPKLTDAEFDKLQQAERDGNKTRKSLLKAFDEEWARRAALAEDLGMEYDDFVLRLDIDLEELEQLLASERENANRERVIEAYQAEIERRAADDGTGGE